MLFLSVLDIILQSFRKKQISKHCHMRMAESMIYMPSFWICRYPALPNGLLLERHSFTLMAGTHLNQPLEVSASLKSHPTHQPDRKLCKTSRCVFAILENCTNFRLTNTSVPARGSRESHQEEHTKAGMRPPLYCRKIISSTSYIYQSRAPQDSPEP